MPPRSGQPYIYYKVQDTVEYTIYPGLPLDRYELEPCSLNALMAQHKKGACWPLYIRNSTGDMSLGSPFGFLKFNHMKNVVVVHILPYNFPVLNALLEKLPANLKMSPPQAWRQELESYCMSIPSYYLSSLKLVLRSMSINVSGVPDVPTHPGGTPGLSRNCAQQIEQLRNHAKLEVCIGFVVSQSFTTK